MIGCCALVAYVVVMWSEWRAMPERAIAPDVAAAQPWAAPAAASGDAAVEGQVAALRQRAARLDAALSAAAAAEAPEAVDGGPEAEAAPPPERYAERCFDGADEYDKRSLSHFAHGLTEFSVSLSLRVSSGAGAGRSPCGALPANGTSAQWHSGGCGLVSGVRGFLRDRDDWWHARRTSDALGPRESLAPPRGNNDADRRRRAFLDDAMARGSRSDWGVSLAPDGSILFGHGHRDFGTATMSAGTERAAGRPVRDLTFRAAAAAPSSAGGGGGAAPDLLDGAWHDVVVVRKRRNPVASPEEEANAFLKPFLGPHDTSELRVYVDGARRGGAFVASGGRYSDAATNNANKDAGGSPGYLGSAPPHPLVDSPVAATLGERFRGCLRDVAVHASALDPSDVALGAAALARSVKGPPKRTQPIPLYFYAHSDADSREMRDKFVASIRDSGDDVVLREWVVGDGVEDQSKRFSTKIDLVLRAIRENPKDSVVIVSDVDVRFFKPVAPVVDAYVGVGDAYDVDVAFQRDEDRSLQVNLGFMALKCNKAVADLFKITGEIILQNRPGATGDQRIVNRALANPWFYGMPRLKWAVFPSELATNSVVNDHTKDAMYGSDFNNWVLFHANDYGRAGLGSSKARVAKMTLLADAEAMQAHAPGAKRPRDRWPPPPYVGPCALAGSAQHADCRALVAQGRGRRLFPADTEGG